MSLLGKKRIKRSEEDDKVIKIFYNLIIFQEYAKLAGIKEEEEPKDELNENEKENNENNKTELKIENKEIKIIENVINIPVKERIKNTTIKKDSKNKKKEEKEEIKENTDNNNKNDKEKKITENPFAFLVKKENEVEENLEKENNNKENDNNNKEKSIFADFINKNKNKSLFGDIVNTDNTKSLFNSQNDEKNEKNGKDNPESNKFSLFGNTLLFSNKDNNNTNAKKSLFSNNAGKSLFGDNNNNNNSNNTPTLLFSGINIPKNPFQDIKGDAFVKGLFNNNNNNNKSENNEKKNNNSLFDAGDDNDENSDEDDKPKNNYIAEPLKSQDITQFSKLFNLNINNLFLYNKTEKKYISKGRGFFSIEKTKDEKSEKHQAVVVFRNHAGNKLVEGFLDNKFNKFNIFSKDFDFVVCFGIIMINEGKPDFSFIKIPFKNEQNANELKDAYEKAMEFIDKKD